MLLVACNVISFKAPIYVDSWILIWSCVVNSVNGLCGGQCGFR